MGLLSLPTNEVECTVMRVSKDTYKVVRKFLYPNETDKFIEKVIQNKSRNEGGRGIRILEYCDCSPSKFEEIKKMLEKKGLKYTILKDKMKAMI